MVNRNERRYLHHDGKKIIEECRVELDRIEKRRAILLDEIRRWLWTGYSDEIHTERKGKNKKDNQE